MRRKRPGRGFEAFEVQSFLADGECAELVRLIDASCAPSKTWDTNADPTFRTSETCWMDHSVPVVGATFARICRILDVPAAHGEKMQGQRYLPGQQYKPHHDYIRTDRPHWKEQQKLGGQRTWTAMIFLDAPEAGGMTQFPLAGLEFEPRAGTLLYWSNVLPNGHPNEYSLHAGVPVVAGEKHIVTQWFRERPCRKSGIRAALRRGVYRGLRFLRGR